MFVPLTGRELTIGAGSGPPGTIPTPGWTHMGWGLRVSLYVLLNAEHELKVSGEHKPCLFGTGVDRAGEVYVWDLSLKTEEGRVPQFLGQH